ncbi:peptidoglycan-binding protein [Pelagibius sp.]|uniref:peptidoglycan-binding protein n=1 Tax=Pelagibius sp. TaxID=1931238 RepID=UPI0026285375|nr:peptidoglycan-binding protein [Pelagibius sp.]
MDLTSAVRAAAPDAPNKVIEGLDAIRDQIAAQGALDTDLRAAHMIGQCAHESLRFTLVTESLFYTSVDRVMAVFGRHFRDRAHARQFLRNSAKLANHVYANRMGNGGPRSGDGFRFRGRGYLQLTGRDNYRTFGRRIGIDLEADPDKAAEPTAAWLIAASYLANRKRGGKTAFQWADENNVEAVTKIVNGGLHGLADRRNRTARALAALRGERTLPQLRKGDDGDMVVLLQRALAAKGFPPGALDGDFGAKTERALKSLQAAAGLGADGIVGKNTWKALSPLPS